MTAFFINLVKHTCFPDDQKQKLLFKILQRNSCFERTKNLIIEILVDEKKDIPIK